jgi:hypothetical protein
MTMNEPDDLVDRPSAPVMPFELDGAEVAWT